MSQRQNIIFDLDGTLIDSASSIIDTLKIALDLEGFKNIKLNSNIIGPPLEETIRSIFTVENSEDVIKKIIKSFTDIYDQNGYKLVKIYPGVYDLLRCLNYEGHKIYLATNKRTIPTKKILKTLDLSWFFSDIISIDSEYQKFTNKSEILNFLIKKNNIKTNNLVYIGDRKEDFDAATQNNLRFIQVAWGYGSRLNQAENISIVNTVPELQNLLISNII